MKFKSFHDFDAFAASVRDIDGTMLLQNPKHHSWSIWQTNLSGIDIQLGRLGSGNIVEGQSWSDGYLLYLPLTDKCAYSANGTVLDKHSFMLLEPGCDFCISTKDEHDWCSIFLPKNQLSSGNNTRDHLSDQGKMNCKVTRPNHQLAGEFRAFIIQFLDTASNCQKLDLSPAAKVAALQARAIAASIINHQQPDSPSPAGRPRISREEIIRRSKELLEERHREIVLVPDLAAAARVSERTLRNAFKEYFGIGPIRYLHLRQLHQVHRALRAADPEAMSVSDICLQYGVWEFSRFSLRYKTLFGECPSETLRKN